MAFGWTALMAAILFVSIFFFVFGDCFDAKCIEAKDQAAAVIPLLTGLLWVAGLVALFVRPKGLR